MATPFTTTLYNTPLVNPRDGLMTEEWQTYFRGQTDELNAGPTRLTTITQTTQNQAIGVTPIGTATTLTGGVYRITAYARVTAAAVTSSDLTVLVYFVDEGVSCSATFIPSMNGNTTTTTASGTYSFRCDGGPISYSTTYASNGANQMTYDLVLCLEDLST